MFTKSLGEALSERSGECRYKATVQSALHDLKAFIDGWRGRMPATRTGAAWLGTIRDVFRRAFERAGLPYYNPHSFRDMLVRHAMTMDLTPEEMKAWSQNLGHSDVLTTFTSYGTVPLHRQAELIRTAGRVRAADPLDDPDVRALISKIRGSR